MSVNHIINYMNDNGGGRRVCFFDSGIGGIGLLIRCARLLPDADFFYFADNDRVPYGNLSAETLFERAEKVFSEMEKLNPSAAVIACNTVTAVCAGRLREQFCFPIVGIQPAVKPAAEEGRRCVLLVTPATANSPSLSALVQKYGKNVTEVVACPHLAPYIEQNIFSLDEVEVKSALPEIRAENVVLGCTHYAFIAKIIEKSFSCRIFDGAEGTSNRLLSILGISDHRGGFWGDFSGDFALSPPPAVCFRGGNPAKNEAVYRYFWRLKPPWG